MLRSAALTIRFLAVLGFLFAMPLLAFPPISQWLEARVGFDVADFSQFGRSPPASQSELAKVPPTGDFSLHDDQHAPLPYSHTDRPAVIPGVVEGAPRELTPKTEVAPDQRRLDAIRRRLQEIGAEKVALVTVADGPPTYRFSCQMRLEGSSVYRKPFESSGSDPVAAAERVLQALETWLVASRVGHDERSAETGFFAGQSEKGLP